MYTISGTHRAYHGIHDHSRTSRSTTYLETGSLDRRCRASTSYCAFWDLSLVVSATTYFRSCDAWTTYCSRRNTKPAKTQPALPLRPSLSLQEAENSILIGAFRVGVRIITLTLETGLCFSHTARRPLPFQNQVLPLTRDCWVPPFTVKLLDDNGCSCPLKAFKSVTLTCAETGAFEIKRRGGKGSSTDRPPWEQRDATARSLNYGKVRVVVSTFAYISLSCSGKSPHGRRFSCPSMDNPFLSSVLCISAYTHGVVHDTMYVLC